MEKTQSAIVSQGSYNAANPEFDDRAMEFVVEDPKGKGYSEKYPLCRCTGTAERVMSCLQGTTNPTPPTGNQKLDEFVIELNAARVKCATGGLARLAEKGGRIERSK